MKFEQLPLQTERLLLRPLVAEDAAALFAMFSDPRVVRYGSSPPWPDISEAETFIAQALQAQAEGSSLRLGLERRSDGQLIGQCTFFSVYEQNRRAEIGYTMAFEAWGQGFMNEALQALVAYGFTVMDLHRIEADIDPRNTASERSLLRLGFRYEGLLRERWIVAGEISDSGLYGLLRSEWDQSRLASSSALPV